MVPYNFNQNSVFERMLELFGLINGLDGPKTRKHHELERAEIRRSVQHTISAIHNSTNPFYMVDKDHLYGLVLPLHLRWSGMFCMLR